MNLALRAASVGIVRDPFERVLDARAFALAPPHATLTDLAPREPGAWLCIVDGECIPRAQWGCLPRPGSVVVFRALPQGGGGGSNPLRTILQIAAMVVITYFTGGIVNPWVQGAVRVGATLAANALINNLVPLDAGNVPTGGAQQFSAQAQGNLARIGQPIPELFGFDHGWPDLAAQPYSLYSGNEQYLYLLLVVGLGQYSIPRVSVGDTPITSFADATVVRVGTGQSTTSGPGTGIESLDDLVLVDPAWVTSQDVQAVEMKTLDYVGPFAACRPERTVDRIGVDIILPRGLDSGRSITWRVEKREVDDFDAALGAWTTVATETYSTANVVPVRLSYEYTTTAGRWQVRLVRTDARSSSDGSAHDISWLALRGHLVNGTPSLADVTYVAIKVRASGQLSGALRFRAMSRRLLPTWDGSAWTDPTDTRNPAWAIARVLKARNVPDAQIDLDQLLALAQVWDARQDRFDYRFDSQMSTWDALALIARVGRAVPMIRGGKYTVLRDGPETAPVALFGMRNIRRNSMRLPLRLPEQDSIEALDLEYWDHRRWDWVTVTAQISAGEVYGYRGDAQRVLLGLPEPEATRRGRVRMPGIIGEQHAIRTAVYTLADGFYRRMGVEIDTELDGLLPQPLALVVFQHDVGDFGQGGDVADWDAGTNTVETTEPLQWTQGARHYMRLMRPTGTLTNEIEVTPGADEHHAVLASAPDFTPVFDDAGRERTKYVFGAAAEVGALAKVRAIKPRDERTIGLRLLLEDGRAHTADNAWLPGGEEQDPVSDGGTVDTGGGDRIVNLTDRDYSSSILSGSTSLDFRVTVLDDGRLAYGVAGGPTIQGYIAYEWLNPQTVGADVAALYDVRFSVVDAGTGAVATFGGAALDTWLSLGTTRYVDITAGPGPAGGTLSASVRIEIRDAATATLQGSCVISTSQTDNAP